MKTRLRMMLGLLVASGAASAVILPKLAASAEPHVVTAHLPPPKHVNAETRAQLDARMGQHGETMSHLLRSVVLLDRPRIALLAGRIADEEVWAKPDKGRRLTLPKDLAAEETKLAKAARDLAVAASEHTADTVLAVRFAAVTTTCVTCHSVYLYGETLGPGDTLGK